MSHLAVFNHVSEKQEEHAGDKLMVSLGFTPIRFSQPRATKQTPGIPDRRYYLSPRLRVRFEDSRHALSVWWEAKAEGGKQSAHQKAFQALVESCGEEYVVGPLSALVAWCARKGLVVNQSGG